MGRSSGDGLGALLSMILTMLEATDGMIGDRVTGGGVAANQERHNGLMEGSPAPAPADQAALFNIALIGIQGGGAWINTSTFKSKPVADNGFSNHISRHVNLCPIWLANSAKALRAGGVRQKRFVS